MSLGYLQFSAKQFDFSEHIVSKRSNSGLTHIYYKKIFSPSPRFPSYSKMAVALRGEFSVGLFPSGFQSIRFHSSINE